MPAICYSVAFLLIRFTYQFMESSIIADIGNVDKIKVKRYNTAYFVVTITIVAVISIMTYFYPRVASTILVTIPILIVVFNIWVERDHTTLLGKKIRKVVVANNEDLL